MKIIYPYSRFGFLNNIFIFFCVGIKKIYNFLRNNLNVQRGHDK